MSNEVPLKNPAREEFMHQKKNNHAFRGQTYGDADSNGRSDATRQVFVWSHQSSYGYQKQQNLSHRRDSQRLKLEPEEFDKLTILTFGISKSKEITSPLITLTLKSKGSDTDNIKANVAVKISENMQRIHIPLKNRFSIQKKFKLAETLSEQI